MNSSTLDKLGLELIKTNLYSRIKGMIIMTTVLLEEFFGGRFSEVVILCTSTFLKNLSSIKKSEINSSLTLISNIKLFKAEEYFPPYIFKLILNSHSNFIRKKSIFCFSVICNDILYHEFVVDKFHLLFDLKSGLVPPQQLFDSFSFLFNKFSYFPVFFPYYSFYLRDFASKESFDESSHFLNLFIQKFCRNFDEILFNQHFCGHFISIVDSINHKFSSNQLLTTRQQLSNASIITEIVPICFLLKEKNEKFFSSVLNSFFFFFDQQNSEKFKNVSISLLNKLQNSSVYSPFSIYISNNFLGDENNYPLNKNLNLHFTNQIEFFFSQFLPENLEKIKNQTAFYSPLFLVGSLTCLINFQVIEDRIFVNLVFGNLSRFTLDGLQVMIAFPKQIQNGILCPPSNNFIPPLLESFVTQQLSCEFISPFSFMIQIKWKMKGIEYSYQHLCNPNIETKNLTK